MSMCDQRCMELDMQISRKTLRLTSIFLRARVDLPRGRPYDDLRGHHAGHLIGGDMDWYGAAEMQRAMDTREDKDNDHR